MAGDRSGDFLADYRFHLYDVSPTLSLFPFVFNPSIGFSAITAPNIVLDKPTISPGNAYYPHKWIKRANQNTLMLHRGATLQDGDMWRWLIASLTGETGSLTDMSGQRRNLMLCHFSLADKRGSIASFQARQARLAPVTRIASPLAGFTSVPSFAFIAKIPSRAWLLYDCQPASYRVASDFNAKSSEISIREMGIDYSEIDEIDLSI